MATTYLSKTLSGSATDNNKWTWSAWVKRSKLGTGQVLFYADDGSANYATFIRFRDTDQLDFSNQFAGSNDSVLLTNRRFRDTNAWYHIVAVLDTSNSTAADRQILYVNGVRETSFATETTATVNKGSTINDGYEHRIGRGNSSFGTDYFDGSMTHINFVDGQAYDPTTFGETDSTSGIWKPKTSPSVTYGTNGFFLKFENSGTMGTDSSGNSNTFTVGGGTLTQNVDSPSNNYATLNGVASNNSSSVLTNGNLTHTSTTSWVGEYSSLGANAGKWYAEGKITDRMNYSFGVIQNGGDSVANISTANNNLIGKYADGWGFAGNDGTTNNKRNNNTNTSYGEVFSDNDIFMICLDVTGGKIYFGRNGSWFNSSDPASGANPAFTGLTFTDSMHFASGMENGSLTWNFGQGYFGTTAVASANSDANGHGIFEYAVPSGFYALNTKNLKEFG